MASSANSPGEAMNCVGEGLLAIKPKLIALAKERGEALLEAHRRVRKATRATGTSQRIEPKLPVDVLGVFVYLPEVSA